MESSFQQKFNISKEQKQMVMTQANSLERTKIQQALYSIPGQDYKHSPVPNPSRWSSSGKGRGYYVDEENYNCMMMMLGALRMKTLSTTSTMMLLGKMMELMMSSTAKQSTTRRTWPIASWMKMATTLTSTMSVLQALWMLDEDSTNFACQEVSYQLWHSTPMQVPLELNSPSTARAKERRVVEKDEVERTM